MYIERFDEARSLTLTLRRKLRGMSGVDVWVVCAPVFLQGSCSQLDWC
jgi:hypothetical protein